MLQGVPRITPLCIALLMLAAAAIPTPGAAAGAEADALAPVVDALAARADALVAAIGPLNASDPDQKDALNSIAYAQSNIEKYRGTPLRGFVLASVARIEGVRDYLDYKARGWTWVNVPHFDATAAALREKSNATLARIHDAERNVTTLHGFELLVYAGTYVANADVQLREYEIVHRADWLAKGKTDANAIPGVLQVFALTNVSYDYANAVVDLALQTTSGPALDEASVLAARDQAVATLKGSGDTQSRQDVIKRMALAAAERDDHAYAVAVRLTQMRADSIMQASLDYPPTTPNDDPAKVAAAATAAEALGLGIPASLQAAGFSGVLATELLHEADHYLNRSDHESLVRALAASATLEALPHLLAPLAPPAVTSTEGARGTPAASLLVALAALAAAALAVPAIRRP